MANRNLAKNREKNSDWEPVKVVCAQNFSRNFIIFCWQQIDMKIPMKYTITYAMKQKVTPICPPEPLINLSQRLPGVSGGQIGVTLIY
jgi:hypothetical protein